MTTAVQVQYRRNNAAGVAAFTGAAGELVVDTTNQRVVVQDGSTAGGFPTALATRHSVADAAYTAKVTDRIVAYTSLTTARAVALPAASSFPVGELLWIVDESGSSSSANTITANRAGSDTINGATSAIIQNAYGFLALESNGTNGWSVAAASSPRGLLCISPTAGLGYGTGAGGTVPQATNKSTGVTLNTASGAITMNSAALAGGAIVSFVLTDSAIAATDVLILNHVSGGTPGSYSLNAQAAAGSATINVRNNTGGSLNEAIVVQFAVIKAVNS